MLTRARDLNGYSIHTADGQSTKIDFLIFDDENWAVRYLVLELGFWISGKKVLISPVALEKSGEQSLVAKTSKDALRNGPEIDVDQPITRDDEISLHKFFSWPYYWDFPPHVGSSGSPLYSSPVFTASRYTASGQPKYSTHVAVEEVAITHLRSTKSLSGFHVMARNEEIGRIEDILVDDEVWAVRYFIIDIRNWLPGKKVLFSPHWIRGVDWDDGEVYLEDTKETVKSGPEYDHSIPVDRDYEKRLYDYYRRPKYWSSAYTEE